MVREGRLSIAGSDAWLEIHDDRMISNVIPNVATKTPAGGWMISDWDHGRVFTRNEAITAMNLLMLYAQGRSPDDPLIQAWEEELGLPHSGEAGEPNNSQH
ncbi:hypothetical protein GCM10022419_016120 [Nonomuraea rosea]|uniref:DUF4259 domain-containing protein n=1 Tax=Nonomuraea rosea TaxID=638574 RepID=A0ABP6VL76_9ACTN